MFKLHHHCRACGLGKTEDDNKLIEILDLGVTPLANDFCSPEQERQGYAPLKLMWCPRCTLAQLSVTVKPEVLYHNYPYVTSHSQMMKDHFTQLTSDLKQECGTEVVIEIGSNDGTLLEHLGAEGFKQTLGIEPAENLVDAALKKGINTWAQLFSEECASDIIKDYKQVDLVIARHVFCHIDDWTAAVRGLARLCGKHTVIAIEVPYLVDTIESIEWDQVYHEHLSYLTLKSMRYALQGSGLHLHKVIHYPIHGGAILMMLRKDESGVVADNSVFTMLDAEKVTERAMTDFGEKAQLQRMELSHLVCDLVNSGKTVVGYGASAKSTQWIQGCKFTRKQIKWICDETPQKQYKTSPGTDISIVDSGALTRDLPDYAICFAWNFAKEIISKERIFREHGGKWIVPHGTIKIV